MSEATELLDRLRTLVEKPPAAGRDRAYLHKRPALGDRVADAITAAMGSWQYIIWQNVIVGVWIVFNIVGIFGFRFDPMPFILLNLIFSWQASNTGPLLQLTSNRQASIDRHRDDHEAAEVDQLYQINQQQLEILQLLRGLTHQEETPHESRQESGQQ